MSPELNGLLFISSDNKMNPFSHLIDRKKTNHNSIQHRSAVYVYVLLYETNQIPAIDSIENEIAMETKMQNGNYCWNERVVAFQSLVFTMAIHEH